MPLYFLPLLYSRLTLEASLALWQTPFICPAATLVLE
jgi:hypothetical protein